MESIGYLAFNDCSKLRSFFLPANVGSIEGALFFGLTLEVPEGTIDAYKQKGWKTLDEGGVFKEIREIPQYDANGDGQTTIVDVTRLVDKIIGK